jgi:hypothetical protein
MTGPAGLTALLFHEQVSTGSGEPRQKSKTLLFDAPPSRRSFDIPTKPTSERVFIAKRCLLIFCLKESSSLPLHHQHQHHVQATLEGMALLQEPRLVADAS